MSYRDKSIALVAALAVFRVLYIMYAPLDLSPDEAHYWEWARRLDLSYYSKGPLVAWVIALFTGVFGDTELGVRFGAVVFSAAASLVMYAVGRDLFGSPKVGFYSVVLAGFTPLLAVGSILMTTDVLLIFFWVSAVWCAHRVTAEGGTFRPMGGKWWYAVGVLVGVGFLGKYTMVLFYPCVALFLFFSMRDRFWLARPQPYIAGLISLVLAAPVLAWNYLNDFVTIRHTMGQAQAASPGFSFENTVEFLGSQAG
ncbi:MAG TPA: glycosyltransferase family 39 protein, partial [Gammaproteobacteria bacterium]|nr:glycosyltransferase family 39 protein [Gammaproteobacteria bacterium]